MMLARCYRILPICAAFPSAELFEPQNSRHKSLEEV